MKADKGPEKIKCNCRDCKYAGLVKDYMVYCSKMLLKRSTGIRMCMYYEKKKNV